MKCQRCLRRAPVVVGRLGVTVHEGQMRCKLEENHGILVLARGYHQTQGNLKKKPIKAPKTATFPDSQGRSRHHHDSVQLPSTVDGN